MLTLEQLREMKATSITEMEELLASDELTDEQQARFDELNADVEKLNKRIEATETLLTKKAEMEADEVKPTPAPAAKIISQLEKGEPKADKETKIVVPATVKTWGKLNSFKTVEDAYSAGQWYLAVAGNKRSQEWCAEHGMPIQYFGGTGHQEGANTTGGYLVPDQLDNSIIDLKVEYGAFRRNANVVQMTSDVIQRPRRTGGLTAYFVGESAAGTESTKSWDKVQLIAKKLMALTKISSELREDAIISIADDLTREIAYAFAYKEDYCGFLGDGTSTYGGITGISTKLSSLNGVDEGGGMILAAGNLFSEVTVGDLGRCVGKCPTYARAGAKWYCSPVVHDAVIQRLLYAGGGNTGKDLEGKWQPKALGYPVELVEVMPSSDSNSQIMLLFGNLQQAAMMGDRRQTTIAFSDTAVVDSQSVFEQDEIAVRGTERFDINVHDVGSASAAGPVVCLISASA